MTWDKLTAEMNANIKTPGMANIFWMPIQTRTEMLTTGFRSKLGIKIFGPDLGKIQEIGLQIEKTLSDVPRHAQRLSPSARPVAISSTSMSNARRPRATA